MGNWELAWRMMLIGAYVAGGMLAVIVALWLIRITAKAVGRALVLFAVRRMSDSMRLAFYARQIYCRAKRRLRQAVGCTVLAEAWGKVTYI